MEEYRCLRSVKPMKKNLIVILALLLCFSIGTTAYGTEKRTVRVAFFPMDGYHVVNDDGSYGGMDVEYLRVLSNYVGWNVEYVSCESWEEALEKLRLRKAKIWDLYLVVMRLELRIL